MYTSSEIVSILDQAESIAKLITASEVGQCYLTRLDQLQKDERAQQLIRTFNQQKVIFAEVDRYGKYHPDRKIESEKLFVALQEMEQLTVVKHFKQAERALEELLSELSGIIGQTIAYEIDEDSVCYKGIKVAECANITGKS